jgi:Trk K+ transport system NAD-binding subunit
VVGSDRLGLRIGEQLDRDGLAVTLVAVPGSWLAEATLPATWEVLRAQPDAPGVLERAGLERSEALLAVSDEDELNLGAVLAARELRPGIRCVLRQFDLRLGRLLRDYLPDARILSLSASSAATFALAALGPGVVFAHDTGVDTLVLRELSPSRVTPSERKRLLAVASRDEVTWRPELTTGGSGDRALVAGRASEMPRYGARPLRRGAPVAAEPAERDGRRLLILALGALVTVLAGVAGVFAWRLDLSTLDAVYFVSTILTTVGFGDFSLREADVPSKLVGILAMFSGLFLTALLVALVTNQLISRQARRRRGHYRHGQRGHVVVCGAGNVGVRIAEALRRMGESVVAVEPAPRPDRVAVLQAAGVPVVAADGRDERALLHANVTEARSLVVATSDDHKNLEMALVARSLAPDLPIVLRLFDRDLCRRVAGTFGIEASFSGTALGGGLFTAFGPHETRLARLSFAGEAYALHRLEGGVESSVGELRERVAGHVVASSDGAGRLHLAPKDGDPLPPGGCLFVLVPERPHDTQR